MYFLNICENPDILRIIHFALKIFDLVFLVIPMALVVMITIDLVKNIFAEEKGVKGNNKQIITRIVFAVVLFFVPTITNIIMNTLEVAGITSEYQTCIKNAESIDYIKQLEEAKKQKEEAEKNK